MPLKIRKPVNELTAADLNRFPVWAYAIDEEGAEGQDETTVRPYRAKAPLDGFRAQFIVRAHFQLQNGRKFVGSVSAQPRGERGVEDVQPVILTPGGPVFLWHGVLRPKKAELAAAYRLLDVKKPDEAFPISYRSDPSVEIVGGSMFGRAAGFMCFRRGSYERVEIIL